MIAIRVSPASIQDSDMSAPLLKTATKRFSSLARAIADAGYQGPATMAAARAQASIDLEFVERSDKAKGFVLVPKCWIPALARTLRTFGCLGRCRRLGRDFEYLTAAHARRRFHRSRREADQHPPTFSRRVRDLRSPPSRDHSPAPLRSMIS